MHAFPGLDRYEVREDATLINLMARIAENSLRNLFQREMAIKRGKSCGVAIESLRDKLQNIGHGWEPSAQNGSPVDKTSAAEMEDVVDECLAELPEEQREIILLVDFADGGWEFVMDKTGRSSAAAAQRFHRRARVALAAKVARRLAK
jgi:DNA-directed RNA polymerase specialized sigma24 family protein